MQVEYGWPIGMPVCRSIGGGLWEVRSDLPEWRRIARVIFGERDGAMVLLHGFIKKTRRTLPPGRDRYCPDTLAEFDVMTEMEKGRIGSSFDDFLDEEGIREEVHAQALKEVLAWQIEQEMKAAILTKTAMAKRMATSRAQLDRLLDPANTSVTLHTLQKAAMVVGRRLRLELV